MRAGETVLTEGEPASFFAVVLEGTPRELAPLRGMPFSRAMAKLDDKRPGLAKAASKIMMAGRLMKR